MCCTSVKWTIQVITMNIPINRAIKFGVNSYLLSRKPNTRQNESERNCECVDWIYLAHERVQLRANEPSGYVKGETFLDDLRCCEVLKMNCSEERRFVPPNVEVTGIALLHYSGGPGFRYRFWEGLSWPRLFFVLPSQYNDYATGWTTRESGCDSKHGQRPDQLWFPTGPFPPGKAAKAWSWPLASI
jgi:hypothetical protein